MEVQTKYGALLMDAHAKDSIYVRTDGDQSLVVNGVAHTVNAHFSLHPEGIWYPFPAYERWGRLHVNRVDAWDGSKHREPSNSAIEKLTAELARVCAEFPVDELVLAEARRRADAVNARTAQIESARAFVNELSRDLNSEIRLLLAGGRLEWRKVDQGYHDRATQVLVTAAGEVVKLRTPPRFEDSNR